MQKLAVSKSTLQRQCRRLFATTPGHLLSECRLFLLSSRVLEYEKTNNCRSNFLNMPGDFRRSFKRVLGMSFGEFRMQIQTSRLVWIIEFIALTPETER